MDYAAIKTILTANPEWDALDNDTVAANINALTETVYEPLGSDWLLEWALVRGVYQRFKGAILHQDTPAELKLTLEGIVILLERDATTLRLQKPEIQGMLTTLQTAGLLTQDDIDSLYAVGSKTQNVWQRLGRQVEAEDVRIGRIS